jgi:hypothetical protein
MKTMLFVIAALPVAPALAGCNQYNPGDCGILPPPYSGTDGRGPGWYHPHYYSYQDNMGYHPYPNGEPRPTGW